MNKPNIDNEAKKIMVNREAYSEMIDALMASVEWMKIKQPEGYEVATLKMIKALEKAGCYENS